MVVVSLDRERLGARVRSFRFLRHLHQFQPLHVRPRDIRRLRPVATEHHCHAPLRVVAGGILVAADLLA